MQPCSQTVVWECLLKKHINLIPRPPMEQGESGNELLQGLDSGAQKCVLNVKLYYLLHIFKSNSFHAHWMSLGTRLSTKHVYFHLDKA